MTHILGPPAKAGNVAAPPALDARGGIALSRAQQVVRLENEEVPPVSTIRRALSSLPSRPAPYVAIAMIAGVLIYQYGGDYLSCTAHAEARARLEAAIEDAAWPGGPRRLDLAEIAVFDWDRLDIAVAYRPDAEVPGCPLGWDWSAAEREALVADGLLTVLVFSRDGTVVDYIEHRADRGEFRDIVNPYTRESAVFAVDPSQGAPVLRPDGR
jgi:hypothetical protein